MYVHVQGMYNFWFIGCWIRNDMDMKGSSAVFSMAIDKVL